MFQDTMEPPPQVGTQPLHSAGYLGSSNMEANGAHCTDGFLAKWLELWSAVQTHHIRICIYMLRISHLRDMVDHRLSDYTRLPSSPVSSATLPQG